MELHWVPGHRKVPGNELADLVSNRAIAHGQKIIEKPFAFQSKKKGSFMYKMVR